MILMASSASAGVLISSRYAAIEIIPVAITKAKYPGNRSAAARRKPPRCLCVGSIIQSGGFFSGFFIAAFAIEFESKARGATFCAEHRSEERRVGKECRSRWWREQSKKEVRGTTIEMGE